jgi:hypothetical protein
MSLLLSSALMGPETGTITVARDEMRDWVEERGGKPALAPSTAGLAPASEESEEPETRLRIDFGRSRENLKRISWEEFFKLFEADRLAFRYDSDAENESGPVCSFVDRTEYMEWIENGGLEEDDEEEGDEEAEGVDEGER